MLDIRTDLGALYLERPEHRPPRAKAANQRAIDIGRVPLPRPRRGSIAAGARASSPSTLATALIRLRPRCARRVQDCMVVSSIAMPSMPANARAPSFRRDDRWWLRRSAGPTSRTRARLARLP